MNPVAHYKLATAQVSARHFDAATVSLKKALALKPDYLDAKILLGSAELGTGRYREAMNIAQQIQKQQPESGAENEPNQRNVPQQATERAC